jgi:hypothetical protein
LVTARGALDFWLDTCQVDLLFGLKLALIFYFPLILGILIHLLVLPPPDPAPRPPTQLAVDRTGPLQRAKPLMLSLFERVGQWEYAEMPAE